MKRPAATGSQTQDVGTHDYCRGHFDDAGVRCMQCKFIRHCSTHIHAIMKHLCTCTCRKHTSLEVLKCRKTFCNFGLTFSRLCSFTCKMCKKRASWTFPMRCFFFFSNIVYRFEVSTYMYFLRN